MRWLILGWCLLLLLGSPSLPAIAAIHHYPEGGDREMIRSLQSLRDAKDQSWQVIFYERRQGSDRIASRLRLVGFPAVRLLRQTPLIVEQTGRQLSLPNVTDQDTQLSANVAEFDSETLLPLLDRITPLRLQLDNEVALTVPPFMVKEWAAIGHE
ncbi:DUF3122 domain-containing protein [Synechococcus elongatus IITB7]|uniref:DUF3122 domain-containing protein n=1 Tax=Synechococcus elongatus TaxID=32046 RepID=UPI0030D1CCE8